MKIQSHFYITNIMLHLFLTLTCALPAFAAELPYLDKDFSCISQEKINQYVDDFSINARSFGGIEKCDGKIDSKKLFNDLQLIEDGKFAAKNDKGNILIKGFVAADQYYHWLKNQTRGIRRGNDIPAATAYNQNGYFTMQDGWATLSTLGRVGVVIHEARHTEGYTHVRCQQGSYFGARNLACDATYGGGGSHAVEMEYYGRVATVGLNFHPVYKTMARLMAMARANFVFNAPVITPRQALLAQEKISGKAYLITNNQLFERETPNVPGVLKRTSYGAVVFDGIHAFSIEMSEKSGYNPNIEDSFSYFKFLKKDHIGQKWSDFSEFDLGKNRFALRVLANKTIENFNFPEGVWFSPMTFNDEIAFTSNILENGQLGYFLITKTGEITPVDVQNNRIGKKLQEAWNPEFRKIAKVQNEIFILKTDGRIYQKAGSELSPYPLTESSQYRDIVDVPVYNAFEVKN